ncbi:MAG: AarF/ABC1/UbiB kinase family protein [Planctomycetes bacterium]|nr:AarF/ABC1/UbiB kinase family protein [Planctomycetota bacterium]
MHGSLGISRALRTTRRVRDIVTVLVRHGLGDLAEGLGIDRTVRRVRRVLGSKVGEPNPIPDPVRVRRVLEDLGPTFVKLGQVLATRADMVPPDWSRELSKLHSDAQPVPWPRIEGRLRGELGDRYGTVVRDVEHEPIAAASVAQVHRAKLADGTPIVLKILRPGIRDLLAADVALMRTIAHLIEHRYHDHGYSPTDVVEQFAREIAHETDLEREGRSTERLAEAFQSEPGVRFARVHWEATTPSVLAMEELRGVLLARTDYATLAPELRTRIVARCADAVFRQCFELGFFHADPHPGNILVDADGTVCFLDCGMTGHVDPDTAERLADLVRGTIAKDLETVVRAAVALAETEPALVYDRRLRADVWEFMGRFGESSLADLRVGALLQDFFGVLRRNRVRCAADLVYLIKAIATIEGVATSLAPDFDLVEHVRPRIERLVRRRYGPRALRRRLERSMLGYAEIIESFPAWLREVFDRVQRSRLTLQVDHKGLRDVENTVREAAMTLAYALLVGALILGSAVLLLADSVSDGKSGLTWLAALGFVSSLGLAFWRVFQLWLGGR